MAAHSNCKKEERLWAITSRPKAKQSTSVKNVGTVEVFKFEFVLHSTAQDGMIDNSISSLFQPCSTETFDSPDAWYLLQLRQLENTFMLSCFREEILIYTHHTADPYEL